MQFGSFLLLPLFFGQVLYPKYVSERICLIVLTQMGTICREWKAYWVYVCSGYAFVVLGLTAFMVFWAIEKEVSGDVLNYLRSTVFEKMRSSSAL